MSLPAATALPDLKSRHRLFFLNRQRGIRGRGVDELEEESSGDDELEEESSDDELEVEDDDVVSTGTQANIKSPSVDPSPAILAASTTSTSVQASTSIQSIQSTASLPPATVIASSSIVPTLTTAQPLAKETTSSQLEAPTVVSTASEKALTKETTSLQSNAPSVEIPKLLGTSTFNIQGTSSGTQIVATTPAKALGLGSVDSPTPIRMTRGAIVGVVFGVLSSVLIAVLLLWLCVRRSRKDRQEDEFSEKGVRVGIFESLRIRRKERFIERSTESRIWGGESTSGPRTEVGDIPAYASASMTPGGVHLPPSRQPGDFSGSLLSEQLPPIPRPYISRTSDSRSSVVSTPPPISKDIGREGVAMSDNGSARPPTRWFGRDSTSSVPRFRDIKSWARDQTMRTASKLGSSNSSVQTGVPNLPTGPYSQM